MLNTYLTSIKINKQMHHELIKKVIDDGYGMRGKSKWIAEAINSFLGLQDFIEYVNLADEADGMTEAASFRLVSDLAKKLDDAVIAVRKEYPSMEGVRSKIIRASIIQRLLRG